MDAIDIRKGAGPLVDQRGILAEEWGWRRLINLLGEHDIAGDAIRKQTLDALGELQRMQPRDREMTQ